MLLVTTLSYDQFGAFIRDKQICLNNVDLIFGYDYPPIKKYILERLGSSGYVVGIRGRINNQSVNLLSQLDKELMGNRIVVEVDVKDDDVLSFNVNGLEEAAQLLTYGLPEEMVIEQLDASLVGKSGTYPVEVVCAPSINRNRNIRITSLNRDVELNVEGITFVKLGNRGRYGVDGKNEC